MRRGGIGRRKKGREEERWRGERRRSKGEGVEERKRKGVVGGRV